MGKAARCAKTSKIRYATEGYARAQLVGVIIKRNRGSQTRQERTAYRCPHCNGWHLTKL